MKPRRHSIILSRSLTSSQQLNTPWKPSRIWLTKTIPSHQGDPCVNRKLTAGAMCTHTYACCAGTYILPNCRMPPGSKFSTGNCHMPPPNVQPHPPPRKNPLAKSINYPLPRSRPTSSSSSRPVAAAATVYIYHRALLPRCTHTQTQHSLLT